MIRKVIALLAVVLITAGWAIELMGATAPENEELRLAYPTFQPFHWRDTEGNMRGLFYDIITEAIEHRMHQPLSWTAYPWARCQENVKSGKADALLTVPTTSRLVYTVTHKVPFFEKPLHLFTYANHPRLPEIMMIKSLADIKRLDFSVITYSGNGWHNDNIRPLGIVTHETGYVENVWIMLRQRRGDLIIEWPTGARPDIQKLGFEQSFVDTGIVIGKMPFYLLIRKDSRYTDLLDHFDETIATMSSDGTLAKIISTYE